MDGIISSGNWASVGPSGVAVSSVPSVSDLVFGYGGSGGSLSS